VQKAGVRGARKADVGKSQLFYCAQALKFGGINNCGFAVGQRNGAMNWVADFDRHRHCFEGFSLPDQLFVGGSFKYGNALA
jgi:hypothetical protein